jgi:hypothetical protein
MFANGTIQRVLGNKLSAAEELRMIVAAQAALDAGYLESTETQWRVMYESLNAVIYGLGSGVWAHWNCISALGMHYIKRATLICRFVTVLGASLQDEVNGPIQRPSQVIFERITCKSLFVEQVSLPRIAKASDAVK